MDTDDEHENENDHEHEHDWEEMEEAASPPVVRSYALPSNQHQQ